MWEISNYRSFIVSIMTSHICQSNPVSARKKNPLNQLDDTKKWSYQITDLILISNKNVPVSKIAKCH